MVHIKKIFRDFLLAQWLRLHPPNAEGPGLIPGGGTRSHMPQISALMAQLGPNTAR